MVYLKKFTLLDEIQEHNIEFNEERRKIKCIKEVANR